MASNFFRHTGTLNDTTSGVTSTVTGTTYKLRASNSDEVPDYEQVFQVVFAMTGSSMTTATITPKLQTSWDGTNWVDVVSGTALTADGSSTELKVIGTGTASVGPYVRAVTTITGTATYVGSAILTGSGRFTLTAVS